MVKELIREKRMQLEQKTALPLQDLITCLLSIRNVDNEEELTEKEILHNIIVVMAAGYDTSSVVITFLLRLLANEPAVYAALLQGMHNPPTPKILHDIRKMKPSSLPYSIGSLTSWNLCNVIDACSFVFAEQEEIARSKSLGELLTWEDLAKMKYTWRVTMEILRTTPPVFGGMRRAMKDIEYGGFLIPQGWQVSSNLL